jgi:hypothetical protein
LKPIESKTENKPSEQFTDPWKPQIQHYNLVQKFLRKIFFWLPDASPQQTQNSEDNETENSKEDSQADGLFTDDKDIMFPEEP